MNAYFFINTKIPCIFHFFFDYSDILIFEKLFNNIYIKSSICTLYKLFNTKKKINHKS